MNIQKTTVEQKAFQWVRKQIEGNDPYEHIANLYASIETAIAEDRDVMGCRLIRSMLDELIQYAEDINWLKEERK